MRSRKYRARRGWHNTVLWAMVSLFLLVAGILMAAVTGLFDLLAVVVGVVLAGFLISVPRDRAVSCHYVLDGQLLTLRDRRGEVAIALSELQDASLIDRMAARSYIQQRLRIALEQGLEAAKAKARLAEFRRYCSVDIGTLSFSFGLGRRMIDRMPDARYDLVLLRLRDGREYLLSPIYNRDMVDGLTFNASSRKSA